MRTFILATLLLTSCATPRPHAHSDYSSGYRKYFVDGEQVHLYSIDLKNYEVRPIKAQGLMTTRELAKQSRAVAAINGGFFQADGTPAGILVINKAVFGFQTKPRAALGWSANNEEVLIDRLLLAKSDHAFVSATGWTTPSQWEGADYIIGGTPLLVRNFQIVKDFDAEKVRERFLELKHARTAICVRDSNEWIFVVVDGSSSFDLNIFSGRSGFTMLELANFMKSHLGCRSAINLDGGGSSTLVVGNEVVNSVTHSEREVSDALGVFPRVR